MRVEFSEDDVAAFAASSYLDFRAVRLTPPSPGPGDAAVTIAEVLSANTPVPDRVENGRQIYVISAPITQINSTYAAVPITASVDTWERY